LALRPEFAEALCNQGVALLALERFAEALASLDQAAALRPDLADIHCNRGNALRKLERLEEALASYDRALALRPDYAEALANRALVLQQAGQPEAALSSFDRALALDATLAEAHLNRALLLRELDRAEEALPAAERALALDPRGAAAHACRGAVLGDLGRVAEARESYGRAVELAPETSAFAMSAAVLDLRMGRLAEGWYCYEWRWDDAEFRRVVRSFAQPRWHGEPLQGRTLLVHADQGFGDTIQFCRYLPLLAGRGRVLLEVQPPLLPLLRDLPGPTQVFATGEALPPFDLHVPLLNLPGVLQTTIDTIPPVPDVFRPDPARARAWAARLPRDGRLRVGLAWSGNPGHSDDGTRSMPLAQLRPLAGTGAAFHVVHTQLRDGDREELARFPDLVNLAAELADFADTAAALAQLDLVIAVDTSVAHLAAAMGVPTWIMVAAMPDWRWLLDRDDSPWYPSVRLFRRRRRGDWAEVVQRVRGALDDLLARRASR